MKEWLSRESRRRRKESPPTADRLAETLLELIAAELMDAAKWIRVDVDRGTALLTGWTTSREARDRAEEITSAAGGVDRVDNRLRIGRPGN